VRTVWAVADIAAVPTLGGEGIPRALLEAAACARPVVASRVSGCSHFVRDGVEGFLAPPGDPQRLADALERLSRHSHLRREQGAAARQRFLAGYTTQAVGAAVREAYEALMRPLR
jgi:glycosyltransferase involved in cell wall biosynthesis